MELHPIEKVFVFQKIKDVQQMVVAILNRFSLLSKKKQQPQRTILNHPYSIQNSPWQSANAKAFAEAYLHFTVFASAIKMLRQLNA